MKKALFFILILFPFHFSCGQSRMTVVFKYDKQALGDLPWKLPDGIEIGDLRFYISSLTMGKNGEVVWRERNSYHLLDAKDPSTLSISMSGPGEEDVDFLEFYLGVDSAKSESGVMDGDLDPLRGMFWTWQSGYIHFRMEGTCSACPPPRREFQLHLGGYRHPFSSVKRITLPIKGGQELKLHADLKFLMNQVSFPSDAHIMSPGTRACALAEAAS